MRSISGQAVLRLEQGLLPPRQLIGGKAWSIAKMSSLGLRVPPAFVITTSACIEYLGSSHLSEALRQEIADAVSWLEARTGRRFGSGPKPLLVAVRSGAAVSMPGMMDTVLNLGINEATEMLLAAECGDPAFARETHSRFLDLYGRVVLKAVAPEAGAAPPQIRESFAASGRGVPDDLQEQLHAAIEAVFRSWNSPRARRYRSHQGIPDDLGTAVTIQAMVFGNADEESGTGVLFTRNPISGARQPYGEYLHRAQGEQIVSGTHTPAPLDSMKGRLSGALDELLRAGEMLENAHRDVQDIEFTVERGRLYLLQSRAAKRSPDAAVRIAVEMVADGRISESEALERVTPEQIRALLRPKLVPGKQLAARAVLRGEAASPGVGIGTIVATADEAEARAKTGEQVVLARSTTSPDDLHGLLAAAATVTEQGGSTSHAAVVARAIGKPCVVGCGPGTLSALIGRVVTVDGNTGAIYEGSLALEVRKEEQDPYLRELLGWASSRSPVRIVSAADQTAPFVDLDELPDLAEPGRVAQALSSLPAGTTVGGAIFSSDERALTAAIAAGFNLIVTSPRLPALLVSLRTQAARNPQPNSTETETHSVEASRTGP